MRKEVKAKMGEQVYRRFIPIGTKTEMGRLNSLVKEKSLSRDDLIVVLRAIKLNPDIFR